MKKPRPKKYDKPISLYPLNIEEVLAAFMAVDPDPILRQKKAAKAKALNPP